MAQKGLEAEIFLKHADDLDETTGKEYCAALGLNKSWATEFAKMMKISKRLKDAGLDPVEI